MPSSTGTKQSVVVSPAAVVSMMLHAANHVHDPVHGVLMGSFGSSKINVTEAIPVCHGPPTHPLVETALALIESINDTSAVVVGWYVSPRLLKDDRPGPAALKIVSSLASGSGKEPALLVVRNDNDLAKVLLEGDEQALDSVVKAFGKNFGQQWLEPLTMSVDKKSSTSKAVQTAWKEKLPVVDLADHLESDPKTSKWYPNDSLTRFVKQHT